MTTASGAKMGKTANGAVWLNEERLSPYEFWQYWRNTEDADVGRFLRLFTELPLDEIARLESLDGAAINDAKKVLADQVTALCHGAAAASTARQTAEQTFEQGTLSENLPTYPLSPEQAADGVALLDLLVTAEFAASKGEARRLVRGGGVKLNDGKVDDENQLITAADIIDGTLKLSAGKTRHALFKTA